MELNIDLEMEWIPTVDQAADEPSRRMDRNESKLRDPWRHLLTEYIGINVDVFGASWNTVCPRFYSRYYEPEAEGVNGMTYLYTKVRRRDQGLLNIFNRVTSHIYTPLEGYWIKSFPD